MNAVYSGMNRRWYDQTAEVSQCVGLMGAFPAEILRIIADGVVYLAEREFEAHVLLTSLKSLGPEKILHIYKSKNKRRSLDEDPALHKAMTYLFLLSDENRLLMARKITELIGFIYQYFETCKQFKKPSSREQVADLTSEYIRNGGDEARHFLAKVQKEFRHSVIAVPTTQTDTIRDDESGLRVKKNP